MPIDINGETALFVACSDGAGSAAASEIGSRVVCDACLEAITGFFASGRKATEIDTRVLFDWVAVARSRVLNRACADGREAKDLSSTLLLGLVVGGIAAFAQIGDGAMVIGNGTEFEPVFWPQTGEYHNTTYFVTDPDWDQHIQLRVTPDAPVRLAAFTDGVQMLALTYSSKSAHVPFFAPLFAALESAEDHTELAAPLRRFLDSEAVNSKTDDDKTLVLAARVSSRAKDGL